MPFASAYPAEFRRAQLTFFFHGRDDTNNYTTKSCKTSFIEQDKKPFLQPKGFSVFSGFHMSRSTIALLFFNR